MSRRLFAVAVMATTALATLAVPAAAAVPPSAPGSIPGAWIVTLDEGQSPQRVSSDHARQYGAQIDHLYQYAITGYAARMSELAADRVASDPRVASVERDRLVTATEHESTHELPYGVDRVDGELSSVAAGDGAGVVDVDVAVIDTGIATHKDLDVEGGRNCSTGKSYSDGNGHGTHVAGTIGARDDGKGVVGVAPGARLWAVRVLDNRGSGSWSSVVCGVDWVTANAGTIEVANMSLGGGGTDGDCASSSLHQAICNSVDAGITYVVAAGNSSADAEGFVPATYGEVITVSALADFNGQPAGSAPATCRSDVDDTFADFSNYGADVDLIAPGVCIRSTWLKGGYNTISGTSMASPHVAGAAALWLATNPGGPGDVKAALLADATTDWFSTTDPDGSGDKLLSVATF